MLERLRIRWNLKNTTAVWLVLLTFACTGTTVAYLSRAIVHWIEWHDPNHFWERLALKSFVFIFGYQIIILCFGWVFGQFQFFWNYEKKIWNRILGRRG